MPNHTDLAAMASDILGRPVRVEATALDSVSMPPGLMGGHVTRRPAEYDDGLAGGHDQVFRTTSGRSPRTVHDVSTELVDAVPTA